VFLVSYNRPQINSNARWYTCGITFADRSIIGETPRAIFIDKNDTVYIANRHTNKLIMWNNKTGYSTVNLPAQLQDYSNLFATRNREIYFSNSKSIGQIDKWTINSVSSTFVAKFSQHCYGLFIDVHDFLYCSLVNKNRVEKINLHRQMQSFITVAGTEYEGSASNQLRWPHGIFVDSNLNLYVSDSGNHRIQLFRSKQSRATTIAGQGIPMQLILKHPTDVILDADNNVYISDNENNRIIKVKDNRYQCLVGCTNQLGSTLQHLYKPFAIRFDSTGTLYVADEYNHRIQKFDLAKIPYGIYLINVSFVVIKFSLFLDCPMPTIEIYPSSSYLKFTRNQNVYISLATTYNCTVSIIPRSIWKIFKSSNQTESTPSFETSENDLFIPARTLSFGIYKVELTATTPVDPAKASFVTYIEICQSNIFIHFFPFQATTITHHYTEDLILNPGEYSFQINEISFHKEVN